MELLITVHGIRTNGRWQERLHALFVGKSPNHAAGSYKFGFFDLVKFANPLTRRGEVRRFRGRVQELVEEVGRRGDVSRIHFVAHSFGTHLVFHALRNMPEFLDRLGTVIFCSSVLPAALNVRLKLVSKSSAVLYNFCSVNDLILVANAMLPLGSGLAGRVGFIHTFEDARLQNAFFRFGHSGYFAPRYPDPDADWFLREWCLPALVGQPVPRGLCDRPMYGDLFSSFFVFGKYAFLSILVVLTLSIYVSIDAADYFDRRDAAISALKEGGQSNATIVREIVQSRPHFPYTLFERAWEFEGRMALELKRRIRYNDVVYVVPRSAGGANGVISNTDLSFLTYDEVQTLRLFMPVWVGRDIPLPPPAWRSQELFQGPVGSYGFSQGETLAYYLADRMLHLDCSDCDGALPNELDLSRVNTADSLIYLYKNGDVIFGRSKDDSSGEEQFFSFSPGHHIVYTQRNLGMYKPNPTTMLGGPGRVEHMSPSAAADTIKVKGDKEVALLDLSKDRHLLISLEPGHILQDGNSNDPFYMRETAIAEGREPLLFGCNIDGCDELPGSTGPQVTIREIEDVDVVGNDAGGLQVVIRSGGVSHCADLTQADETWSDLIGKFPGRAGWAFKSCSELLPPEEPVAPPPLVGLFEDRWALNVKEMPLLRDVFTQHHRNHVGEVDVSSCSFWADQFHAGFDVYVWQDSVIVICGRETHLINSWGPAYTHGEGSIAIQGSESSIGSLPIFDSLGTVGLLEFGEETKILDQKGRLISKINVPLGLEVRAVFFRDHRIGVLLKADNRTVRFVSVGLDHGGAEVRWSGPWQPGIESRLEWCATDIVAEHYKEFVDNNVSVDETRYVKISNSVEVELLDEAACDNATLEVSKIDKAGIDENTLDRPFPKAGRFVFSVGLRDKDVDRPFLEIISPSYVGDPFEAGRRLIDAITYTPPGKQTAQ